MLPDNVLDSCRSLPPEQSTAVIRALQRARTRNRLAWVLVLAVLFPLTLGLAWGLQQATESRRQLANDAAQAMNERSAALLGIVNSADTAVVVTDPHGRICGWSHGAARLLGWSPEEILGRPVETLMPSGLREEHLRRFANPRELLPIVASRPIWRIECDVVRRDGERLPAAIDLRALPQPAGGVDQACYLVLINDLRAIQRIEAPAAARLP